MKKINLLLYSHKGMLIKIRLSCVKSKLANKKCIRHHSLIDNEAFRKQRSITK